MKGWAVRQKYHTIFLGGMHSVSKCPISFNPSTEHSSFNFDILIDLFCFQFYVAASGSVGFKCCCIGQVSFGERYYLYINVTYLVKLNLIK